MKKVILFSSSLLFFLFTDKITAQQETEITSEGILIPRMDHTTIASPTLGQMVFDTNTDTFWFYDGSTWNEIIVGAGSSDEISDSDNDTKVQVEEAADDDNIRFDMNGIEHFVMDGPVLGVFNSGNSVFIGEGAGASDDLSSNFNSFIGYMAGNMTTTGSQNVAIGNETFEDNISGASNTAVGRRALHANTSGNANSAFGSVALQSNTDGVGNSAIGFNALSDNVGGDYNTGIGQQSLSGNVNGNRNTALGVFALDANISGSNNLAIGYSADVGSGALSNATAIGYNALVSQSNAMSLGGLGAFAVDVGIGTDAPDATLHVEGDIKIVDGNQSTGKTLVSDADGLASWDYITMTTDADNDTKIQLEEASDEDKIRFDLGGTEYFVMDGPRLEILNSGSSVFIGEGAGANDDSSNNSNTFVGNDAGNGNSTGYQNSAFGADAFRDNTEGENNSAFGFKSLLINTVGDENCAFGVSSLRLNTDGVDNCAFGVNALNANTSGFQNTGIGHGSLLSNTTGNRNTAVGKSALESNTTGSWNTGLGYLTDVTAGNLSNATAIGYFTEVDASNKVWIGNSSVTSNGGQVAWTAYSDARIKNNIQENIPGLSFINRLRPVSYHFDLDKQNQIMGIEDNSNYPEKYDIENIVFSGFLAQEVDEAAQSIGYDFSGVDKSGKLLGLRYAEFVVPLVKAVQELDKQNANLIEENQALKEESLAMKNQLNIIMARLDALEGSE